MKIKLVAVDMDGTLLDNSLKISERTLDMISRLKKMGVPFVISTGRSKAEIDKYRKQINYDCPIITSNGAIIFGEDWKKVLYHKPLEKIDVKKIFDFAMCQKSSLCFWDKNNLWTTDLSQMVCYYGNLHNVIPQIVDIDNYLIENDVNNLVFCDKEDKIEDLFQKVSSQKVSEANFVMTCPTLLEFFNKEVSKGSGLKIVCDYLGVDLKDVLAIGDSNNDIDFVKNAGLGVAMGNATEKVKSVASYVTSTNEEEGVAKAVEKFLF